MKKRVLLVLFLLLISISFTIAQENITDAQAKVDKAYDCLQTKVQGNCGSLALQEKIFTLLATGECRDEVVADSLNAQCWPGGGCTIKDTAMAILALDKTTVDTKVAEEWLLSQNTSPEDVEWYLQIESEHETRCVITYDGMDYPVVLKEDKQLTTGARPCLRLSSGDWWLKISPTCYDREYTISCDEDFQTNLLFRRTASETIHVSDKTSSASAQGKTKEKVNSACFMQGGECVYEGSLWAAMVLNSKGYNIEAYMPYLSTTAEENQEFLPESFLYQLTGQDDYRNNLLLKQKSNKFWDEKYNKFYDTAIALFSISDEPPEKMQSKEWLLEIQDSDGCWQGNIRDTAFVLASVWPRNLQPSLSDCESSGYYCMSEVTCEGNILSSYSCPGVLKCCDTLKPIQPCTDQTGIICNSDQQCVGGLSVSASDLQSGETCCVGGTCEQVALEDPCVTYGGRCAPFGCESGEQEAFYECSFGDTCCIQGAAKKSYWWIWLLLVLIILVVLGIVFRKRLQPYWFKLKSKFKRGPKGPAAPSTGFRRPGPPGMPMRRNIPRRVLPPSQRRPATRPRPAAKKPGELGNVLSKLKEMSK